LLGLDYEERLAVLRAITLAVGRILGQEASSLSLTVLICTSCSRPNRYQA
jgi:hypothetical protein